MTIFELVKKELKTLFTTPGVFLPVFAGVFLYSFLYPLPYAQQVPAEQSITVANLDNSLLSRKFERMVEATPQVKITKRAHSIEEAKQQLLDGDVHGILVIPEHFYRDLLLGKSPTLSYSGDASYFLIYGTIIEGLARTGGTVAATATVARMVFDGAPISQARQQYAQVKINMKPTFNPTGGYLNYVVPAVFMLILQQTLIMGVGIMGCKEQAVKGDCFRIPASKLPTLKLLLVRTLIFVGIYYLLAMYYFGWSFDFYSINQLASPITILGVLAPFLLTCTFIGIFIGAILPRAELISFWILTTSMPIIFSAGFIWPTESMPLPMVWLANFFPAVPTIQSFLMINQMGADLSHISTQWSWLWAQVFVWGCLAYFTYKSTQYCTLSDIITRTRKKYSLRLID